MRRPLPLIMRRLLVLVMRRLLQDLRLKQCANLQMHPRLNDLPLLLVLLLLVLLLLLLVLLLLLLVLLLLLLLLPGSKTLSLVLIIILLVSLRRRLEPQPHPLCIVTLSDIFCVSTTFYNMSGLDRLYKHAQYIISLFKRYVIRVFQVNLTKI
jgi:hypothetical protein